MSRAFSTGDVQELAMPLNQSQIKAAAEFWSKGWETSEFGLLKEAFPNPQDAVSIKAIVLNALYGTNIISIGRVARCIERVLEAPHSSGPNLVEELVNEIRTVTRRNDYSFASKYAHFFVDSNIPILDSYAEWMLGQHLGKMQSKNPHRWGKFIEDIEMLKQAAHLICTSAELDSYLWVAGEYWWWIKHHHKEVNGDLVPYFERFFKDPEKEPELARLIGPNAGSGAHDKTGEIDLPHSIEGSE